MRRAELVKERDFRVVEKSENHSILLYNTNKLAGRNGGGQARRRGNTGL